MRNTRGRDSWPREQLPARVYILVSPSCGRSDPHRACDRFAARDPKAANEAPEEAYVGEASAREQVLELVAIEPSYLDLCRARELRWAALEAERDDQHLPGDVEADMLETARRSAAALERRAERLCQLNLREDLELRIEDVERTRCNVIVCSRSAFAGLQQPPYDRKEYRRSMNRLTAARRLSPIVRLSDPDADFALINWDAAVHMRLSLHSAGGWRRPRSRARRRTAASRRTPRRSPLVVGAREGVGPATTAAATSAEGSFAAAVAASAAIVPIGAHGPPRDPMTKFDTGRRAAFEVSDVEIQVTAPVSVVALVRAATARVRRRSALPRRARRECAPCEEQETG